MLGTLVPSRGGSRRLNCLIEGESIVFSVTIGRDCVVSDLKKVIQRRRQLDTLKDVQDPHLLELWKVNIDLKPHSEDSLCHLKLELDGGGVEELIPWNSIGEYWPDQPSTEHLHVIVKAPTAPQKRFLGEEDGRAAKRQEIDDKLNRFISSSSTYRRFYYFRCRKPGIGPWLEEIHSRIWGGDEFLKNFVHNVKITAAHYDELRKALENEQSHQDLLAIKLNILLNYRPDPNSPEIPENVGEESGDEDLELDSPGNEYELRSFFPITIEFLDLSSLELKKPQSRLPLPLFIRPEYSDILEEFYDLRNGNISMMVSGQPGIGKTAFLHYMMIRYMIEGVPFLYETTDGFVFHVFSEEVKTITSWDPSESIVAFVDADAAEKDPQRFLLYHHCVRFILTSSPKGSEPFWMKQTGTMVKWIVSLWTPSELYVTGLFLHSSRLDFACLKESVLYFGSNPRRCFQASVDRKVLEYMKAQVTEEINSIDTLDTTLRRLLEGTISTKSLSLSHKLFEIFPSSENRHQSRAQAVSSWALDQLLQYYQNSQANAAVTFYNLAAGVPLAGPLRGDMFQLRVLKYFDFIKHPKTFKIRHLSTSELSEWTYPGPARRLAVLSQSIHTATFKEVVENKKPQHLVPSIPNFAGVDSILYDPDTGLTSFQITINVKRPVAVSGLKRIQQSLKRKSCLAGLRPSTTDGQHWRLIFVVPDKLASDFPLQTFEGYTATEEWATKVDQYVLGLPVDEVFRV